MFFCCIYWSIDYLLVGEILQLQPHAKDVDVHRKVYKEVHWVSSFPVATRYWKHPDAIGHSCRQWLAHKCLPCCKEEQCCCHLDGSILWSLQLLVHVILCHVRDHNHTSRICSTKGLYIPCWSSANDFWMPSSGSYIHLCAKTPAAFYPALPWLQESFVCWILSPACFVKMMCSRPWCLSKCEGAAVHIRRKSYLVLLSQ